MLVDHGKADRPVTDIFSKETRIDAAMNASLGVGFVTEQSYFPADILRNDASSEEQTFCINALLTKREVKMDGYWPSSVFFFAFLWTETKSIETQKRNEAKIQPS